MQNYGRPYPQPRRFQNPWNPSKPKAVPAPRVQRPVPRFVEVRPIYNPANKRVVSSSGKGGNAPNTDHPGGSRRTSSVAAAYSGPFPSSSAKFSSSSGRNGDCRIRVAHCEYMQDVVPPAASGAYQVSSFSINPGLIIMFPWLAAIANSFESYKFHKLIFHYRTESSSATVGKVIYAVDYDASDGTPQSKQTLLTQRTKGDGAPWQDFSMRCDIADLHKFGPQKFMRSTALAPNLDIKTYDVGTLFVATQGFSASVAPGEIWVEYDLELMTPNTEVLGLSERVQSGGGGTSNAAPFGNAPTTAGTVLASAVPASQQFTFNNSGQYLLDLVLAGTALGTPTFPGSTTSVPQLVNQVINAAGTSGIYEILVNTAAGQNLFINPNATTISSASLRIADYLQSLG